MFGKPLNIDIQIYQEEIKKPENTSLVLVPLKNKSSVVHQLVFKVEELRIGISPKQIDDISQVVFKEWQTIFPLYPVERAFANILSEQTLEIYVTFNAANIFSSTQIRNIKKTISEILEKEIKRSLEKSKEKNMKSDISIKKHESPLFEQEIHKNGKQDIELRDQFHHLRKENSDLQTALYQSKSEELTQKENINELRFELERQHRSLAEMKENDYSEQTLAYQKIQEALEETNSKLRQHQQELLEKQRKIQHLQSVVTENERYVASLQSDYDQLRESSNFQLEKILEENDRLNSELIDYKNKELEHKESIQLVKAEMRQIMLETENTQEQLKQKLQRVQRENEELRIIINENQKFEEKTHEELIQTTRELAKVNDLLRHLQKEKELLNKEWETKYGLISIEKEEITAAFKASNELENTRSKEIIDLKNHLMTLEQRLRQAELDKKQNETEWKTRLLIEEREKEQIIEQINQDKEEFIYKKEQEIQRLSERLEQQKQLVDKLMATQSNTQAVWKDNTTTLENNYQLAKENSTELEAEIARLLGVNQDLQRKLAEYEAEEIELNSTELPIIPEIPEMDLESLDQAIEQELAEPIVEKIVTEEIADEEEYYDYESDDEDYGYIYEYDDEDYDYDYHEVDDLVSYNPESVEEDVNELLDNKDDEGKAKITKRDFTVYELYLDNLEKLVDQADGEDFKAFVEPKMKKFKRFKKEFEEDVKSPTLFSRKYKLSTGLENQMKAYVLMSRHLSVLLDVEVSEEDDYGYDYDYDYEYDYEYEED
ncbi:hypothetical protein [Vagococcus fluvialis]|uniref:hypothetical protein n=1 Tax=Vagococcus fluvialis TaxID=2738 RepID=UPI003B5AE58D